MPRSIKLELPDHQAEALDRVAAGLRRTPAETAGILVEECLRRQQFPELEFRDSILGRQAYVAGSTLAVWEFVMVAESYGVDPSAVASHFEWPLFRVEGILAYYRAYPQEVDHRIQENDAITPEEMMKSALPDAAWNS